MNARAERWHRVSELFDRVADLEAGERERVLSAECAGDPTLRAEVERLLQADERTCPVDHDIAAQASTLLLEGDPHEHEGERFGPYRIVKLLGQGGMGRVYLAEREGEDFAQTVALKVVGGYGSFDAATARRRFLEERRILARLQHPHIAHLLDGGVGPEAQPWFAMEYVDGAPLTLWCDQRQLSVHARLGLFAKVCDAVDHAHRFLIVHRDLKPGNVLVDIEGEPKVLDFGIAKLLDEGAQDGTGSTILMTPDYAAPEQIRGGQISTATDVYALGAVLFEVLTGRKPFCDPLASREPPQASRVATEAGEEAGGRAAARGTTPHGLRKSLRGDIDRILRTALDQDPARRYHSAATLAQDLRAVADGRAISLRNDTAYRIRVFLRRHRWGAAAAAAAVAGLMITTGWAVWQTKIATDRAETAKREALAAESISELLMSSFVATDPTRNDKAGAEPTARDVLDAGAASAAEKLAQTPEVLGRVRLMLGRTYLNLRDNDKAAELLKAAARDYADPAVNRPEKTAEAIALLAQVEQNRGNYAQAVVLSRRALALNQKLRRQEGIATSYNTLGMTLISALRYDEADEALQSAQEMGLLIYGDPSKELARALNNRGALASSAGRYSQAERLFSNALEMKAKLEATQADFFSTRSLMAMAIGKQGRLAEAELALSKNVELAPVVYPGDDLRLARAKHRLAMMRHERGDLVRAQEGYEQAIAADNPDQSPPNAGAANATRMLAEVLELRGDIEGAARAYRSAEEMLGEDDGASRRLEKRQATASHGVFLARHGRSGIARDRAEKTLMEWIAMFGQPSTTHIPEDLAPAQLLLAEFRLLRGDPQGAQAALFPDAAAAEQPLLQARRHQLLARIHAARGEQAQANAEMQRAIELADRYAGKTSAITALWRLGYAEWLSAAGQRDQANALLSVAAPILKEQLLSAAAATERLVRLERQIASGGAGVRMARTSVVPKS